MRRVLHALVEGLGVAAMAVGIWQIHPPSALIVGGVSAIATIEFRESRSRP